MRFLKSYSNWTTDEVQRFFADSVIQNSEVTSSAGTLELLLRHFTGSSGGENALSERSIW